MEFLKRFIGIHSQEHSNPAEDLDNNDSACVVFEDANGNISYATFTTSIDAENITNDLIAQGSRIIGGTTVSQAIKSLQTPQIDSTSFDIRR